MSHEKKPYRTTDLAGYFVAGQRVPSGRDADGNRIPMVGHVLHLTDDEAKYELLSGVIEPGWESAAPAPLAPPVKAPSKQADKPAEAKV